MLHLNADHRRRALNKYIALGMGVKCQKTMRKKYWNKNENACLMAAVRTIGIGNWQAVVDDSRFGLRHFSADDLERQYNRLQAGSIEETDMNLAFPINSNQIPQLLGKASARRERRAFSTREDKLLLEGFAKHGPRWSKILRDQPDEFKHRRSTDLRDRFRNAFPEKYARAGFKARSTKTKEQRRDSISSSSTDANPAEPVSHSVEPMIQGEQIYGDFPAISMPQFATAETLPEYDYAYMQQNMLPVLPQLVTNFSDASISTMNSFDLSFSPGTSNSSVFAVTPRSQSFAESDYATTYSPVVPFPDNNCYVAGSALTMANMCQQPVQAPLLVHNHEAGVDDWLGNAIQLQDYKHGDLF